MSKPRQRGSRKAVTVKSGFIGKIKNFFGQFRVTEWLLFLAIVVFSSKPLQDPDFGWHFRAGNDLIKSHFHFPATDPYSYTMPDWPWVNHEWLAQVLVVGIHSLLGNLGLSIVFGLLMAITFLWAAVAVRPVALPYRLIAALLALLASLPILGVRMQMFTLLGIVFTLWAVYRYREGKLKSLWWYPLVMIVWTNLHGGFPIGVGLLVIFVGIETAKLILFHFAPKATRWIQETTLTWHRVGHLALITSLSALATLVNPYGMGLHREIWIALTNSYMYQKISEWQPVSWHNPISYNFIIYLILFAVLFLFSYRKFEPTRLLITIIFLVFSLLHWRNMPFFMLMSVGFLAEILEVHGHTVLKQLTHSKFFLVSLTVIIALLIGRQLAILIPLSLNENLALASANFPIDAINWAKAHPDKIGTRMFNEYGWGGTLLWKFPEQKVFIDGRMPHWRLPALPGQTGERWIFKDHNDIMTVEPGALDLLDKYRVDWALIPIDTPIYWVLAGRSAWQLQYQDTHAAIFTKKS